MVQDALGVRTLDEELGHGGQVERGHRLPGRDVLDAGALEGLVSPDGVEGVWLKREAALQQVQQLLVALVERHRCAALAFAEFRLVAAGSGLFDSVG